MMMVVEVVVAATLVGLYICSGCRADGCSVGVLGGVVGGFGGKRDATHHSFFFVAS